MRTIYKYPVALSGGILEIPMPRDAKIVLCGHQSGLISLWAEVETDHPVDARLFKVYGTGHPLPRVGPDPEAIKETHIGSVIAPPYVWHIYEVV